MSANLSRHSHQPFDGGDIESTSNERRTAQSSSSTMRAPQFSRSQTAPPSHLRRLFGSVPSNKTDKSLVPMTEEAQTILDKATEVDRDIRVSRAMKQEFQRIKGIRVGGEELLWCKLVTQKIEGGKECSEAKLSQMKEELKSHGMDDPPTRIAERSHQLGYTVGDHLTGETVRGRVGHGIISAYESVCYEESSKMAYQADATNRIRTLLKEEYCEDGTRTPREPKPLDDRTKPTVA